MKIAIIGTGYVGLVTGACLADSGNDVTCVDVDQRKVDKLNRGEMIIYEPGLAEVVGRCRRLNRLHFTSNLAEACAGVEIVFLAVGTPESASGDADLKYVWKATEQLAAVLPADAIVVVKSTVPVGTNQKVYDLLNKHTGRICDVCSNPEFLKEGAAIDDFTKPDRVVVGARRPEVGERMKELYLPFLRTERPFLLMSPESAEMTKYVANCMLATKISFINEMANCCELLGADINDVRRGIGHDQRIGFQFLFPGVGYGGSCFPKDVRAMLGTSRGCGLELSVIQAVDEVNERQKRVMPNKLEKHFGTKLKGEAVAIWGLSFKPRTDDIREAPALVLIDWLLAQQARVQVFDPEAHANVQAIYGDKLQYAADPYAALNGASALVIMTEWNDFRHPDFAAMKAKLRAPLIFDGRNLYSLEQMREEGFTYHSIGRPVVS